MKNNKLISPATIKELGENAFLRDSDFYKGIQGSKAVKIYQLGGNPRKTAQEVEAEEAAVLSIAQKVVDYGITEISFENCYLKTDIFVRIAQTLISSTSLEMVEFVRCNFGGSLTSKDASSAKNIAEILSKSNSLTYVSFEGSIDRNPGICEAIAKTFGESSIPSIHINFTDNYQLLHHCRPELDSIIERCNLAYKHSLLSLIHESNTINGEIAMIGLIGEYVGDHLSASSYDS